MSVDAGFADWLRAGSLFTAASDGAVTAAWGALAIETEIASPLATRAGAEAEAARQLGFLSGPLVEDRALVSGLRSDLIGTAQRLRFEGLGYDDPVPVFVIGVEESETSETTILIVLRRLA